MCPMTKMNAKMRRALADAAAIGKTGSLAKISELADLFWPDFTEVDGCVLIRRGWEPTEFTAAVLSVTSCALASRLQRSNPSS